MQKLKKRPTKDWWILMIILIDIIAVLWKTHAHFCHLKKTFMGRGIRVSDTQLTKKKIKWQKWTSFQIKSHCCDVIIYTVNGHKGAYLHGIWRMHWCAATYSIALYSFLFVIFQFSTTIQNICVLLCLHSRAPIQYRTCSPLMLYNAVLLHETFCTLTALWLTPPPLPGGSFLLFATGSRVNGCKNMSGCKNTSGSDTPPQSLGPATTGQGEGCSHKSAWESQSGMAARWQESSRDKKRSRFTSAQRQMRWR